MTQQCSGISSSSFCFNPQLRDKDSNRDFNVIRVQQLKGHQNSERSNDDCTNQDTNQDIRTSPIANTINYTINKTHQPRDSMKSDSHQYTNMSKTQQNHVQNRQNGQQSGGAKYPTFRRNSFGNNHKNCANSTNVNTKLNNHLTTTTSNNNSNNTTNYNSNNTHSAILNKQNTNPLQIDPYSDISALLFTTNHSLTDRVNQLPQLIKLLKQYELICIQKEEYILAQHAKNKIQEIKNVIKDNQIEKMQEGQKQVVQYICRVGEDQIRAFQSRWEQQISMALSQIQEAQELFLKQHQDQKEQYYEKIAQQEAPPVKYSTKCLETRRHLESLIRLRKYREAEEAKMKLKAMIIEEDIKWVEKHKETQRIKMEKLQKKQQIELMALRVKLQGLFNDKIKERDGKFEVLLKKNRKRRVESNKLVRPPKPRSYHNASINQSSSEQSMRPQLMDTIKNTTRPPLSLVKVTSPAQRNMNRSMRV